MSAPKTLNTPEEFRADPTDPRHGTDNGYGNLKCRCDRCRKAWRQTSYKARSGRKHRPIPDHVHGTENGYSNYKCRCDACKAEWSRVTNKRRKARNLRKKEAKAREAAAVAGAA